MNVFTDMRTPRAKKTSKKMDPTSESIMAFLGKVQEFLTMPAPTFDEPSPKIDLLDSMVKSLGLLLRKNPTEI